MSGPDPPPPSWVSLDALDQAFLSLLSAVQASYTALPRASQIRVEQWATLLSQENVGEAWRRHRNIYAELLLSNVRRGALGPPFSRLPPACGALPQLPPETVLAVRAARCAGGARGGGGGGAAAAAPRHRGVNVWSGIMGDVGAAPGAPAAGNARVQRWEARHARCFHVEEEARSGTAAQAPLAVATAPAATAVPSSA